MEDATKKPLTKTEFLNAMAEATDTDKKAVQATLDAMSQLIATNLSSGGPGQITIPGLMKIKVVRKPAVPEREGINPFTKEPTVFKAKPAKNVVKIQPVKALKDAV